MGNNTTKSLTNDYNLSFNINKLNKNLILKPFKMGVSQNTNYIYFMIDQLSISNIKNQYIEIFISNNSSYISNTPSEDKIFLVIDKEPSKNIINKETYYDYEYTTNNNKRFIIRFKNYDDKKIIILYIS